MIFGSEMGTQWDEWAVSYKVNKIFKSFGRVVGHDFQVKNHTNVLEKRG